MVRTCVIASLLLCACNTGTQPAAPTSANVVATVNGQALSKAELDLRLRGQAHAPPQATPEARREALDALITQELYAQQAAQLQLDQDPAFVAAFEQVEAQLKDFRRRELARRYLEKEAAQAAVSEEAVAEYFRAHQARLQTEVRVSQLLVKGREKADALASQLKTASFEEVAKTLFPPLPDGQTPWQLGFLTWNQVPDAWWAELDRLQPGEVSGVITGPNDRAWIIRLDERRDVPTTLDGARPAIQAALKAEALEQRRQQVTTALTKAATITRVSEP